ncbi:UNVERIFIED_CONTAM: hypothetical protein GTU68_022544 [Idotea baltica]|nr:hypothetical protein [Idotea baltica]
MIKDIVINIAQDKVKVSSLMGSGVDPHLFKASFSDIQKINNSDLIFYNGLFLEGKLVDILDRMSKEKSCFAVTRDIDKTKLLDSETYANHYDPHIWFDINLWIEATNLVLKELSIILPQHKEIFSKNAKNYISKLNLLDSKVKKEISKIPSERRILITAHDAFGYFGKAYDIQVKGLQGISTASEFGLYDLKNISDLIIDKKIKAIFVENSVSTKFIKALQEGVNREGRDVKIGGELYSDAMGPDGTKEGTYIGMVEHNLKTIVNALK